MSERPAKRVRQACEPCRRKKSKCPGEKPACSHCARLKQSCFYAEERRDRSVSPTSRPISTEDRLRFLESQLANVIANQSRGSSPMQPIPSFQNASQMIPSSQINGLPPWNEIAEAAELYLHHCDSQPLPLFHRPTFLQSLHERQSEVLFSILALVSRFRGSDINGFSEAARAIVSKNIFDGTAELATIQSLCILTLVDFTDGHTKRSSLNSSLAMSLAHNAGLTTENSHLPERQKEEHRRCFWSLFLLKRLHGANFMILDFSAEDNFPWYPESPNKRTPEDKGIIAYAIQLSEVWFKVTRYAARGRTSTLPPWASQSDYTSIMAQQMDFETRMPYAHRFKPAKFSQQPLEILNANRDYWGPWLFIQFLYHTNLCLLNHPLLLSLRLRGFKSVIPEIFLQHTSDLIASHASWIINFIDMLDSKDFKVSDPFLGHCVAVVATIYLQESVVGTRSEKQDAFEKCLRFIRSFGDQWPHMGRIADKLQRLAETVSSTYVASEESTRQNRKLLIDLGQFFEVLEYSSSSEVSSTHLFGSSLQSTLAGPRGEIASTSILPEPTRVEGQEFGTPRVSVQQLLSDDELAVLAQSFFNHSQRPDFDGINWWNNDVL